MQPPLSLHGRGLDLVGLASAASRPLRSPASPASAQSLERRREDGMGVDGPAGRYLVERRAQVELSWCATAIAACRASSAGPPRRDLFKNKSLPRARCSAMTGAFAGRHASPRVGAGCRHRASASESARPSGRPRRSAGAGFLRRGAWPRARRRRRRRRLSQRGTRTEIVIVQHLSCPRARTVSAHQREIAASVAPSASRQGQGVLIRSTKETASRAHEANARSSTPGSGGKRTAVAGRAQTGPAHVPARTASTNSLAK